MKRIENIFSFFFGLRRTSGPAMLAATILATLVLPMSKLEGDEQSMQVPSNINLLVSIEPDTFLSDTIHDVSIKLTFINNSDSSITIYPEAMELSATLGWGSPGLDIVFIPKSDKTVSVNQDTIRIKEIRTDYGPPDEPPNKKYYSKLEKVLKPEEKSVHALSACWIPGKCLTPEHLSVTALDPEGMDGLERMNLSSCSVLFLNRTSEVIKQAMRKRIDFLRPGYVAFFKKGGEYTVFISYIQKTWVDFQPQNEFRIDATKQTVVIN